MKNNSVQLSAVVIARNEEQRIARCLESLSHADEIIVVDNGSTDDTTKIAREHDARIEQYKGNDFSALRNFGKSKATGVWILYVDADEIVTEALWKEIIGAVQRTDLAAMRNKDTQSPTGYYISRKNYYLGHEWPVRDKMQRLFIKETLVCWEGVLHETAIIKGKMGDLINPLIHETHRTLEEMVEKTNEWSKFEAQLRFDAHHPHVAWWRFFRVMMTGFFRSFIREGGWKMGTVGWIESIYQAFSMFITYAKLWELQDRDERKIRKIR